jgi:hypothetical protein
VLLIKRSPLIIRTPKIINSPGTPQNVTVCKSLEIRALSSSLTVLEENNVFNR